MYRTILRILLLLTTWVTLHACTSDNGSLSSVSAPATRQAIAGLNTTIANAPIYQQKKLALFDSIRSLRDTGDRLRSWEADIALAEAYRQFNADSAIHYGTLAVDGTPENASEEMRTRARLSLANALSTAGLFIPAVKALDSIENSVKGIPAKIEYWKSSRILYSYMLAYVQERGVYARAYRSRYIACDDSLLRFLPSDEPFHKFIFCERLVSEGRRNEARIRLEQLMTSQGKESNIYGMAAFQLAEVCKDNGDFKGYARYLALSAESDIICCVREGIALPTLANFLYEHGDLDNAFNFINYALEEANQGNIRMRTVTISALMPVIDQSYRTELDESRDNMTGFALISTTLFLIAISLLAFLLRSVGKMRSNERKLASSSKKLESYVGNFIGLCSNYASRLEQLTKLITRKISSGQSEDLLRMVSSGKFNEADTEEFYKLIDKALLDIFPDFVESINTLLLPEKKILLNEDDPLTPELRIYAFVRLGVTQSSQIAQILGYSINTVYAYRNRMRNRAIDREAFDSEVGALGESKISPVL